MTMTRPSGEPDWEPDDEQTAGPDVTAHLTVPGRMHNYPLHGPPRAGEPYLNHGEPAVGLILGDRGAGTTCGQPELTVTTLDELDELEAAVLTCRARLAMWYADHPEAAA